MKSLLQTDIWAAFKTRHGWVDHRIDDYHFLGRTLPFGQHLLYAPEITLATDVNFADLLAKAKNLAAQQGAFMLRFEFLAEYQDELADQMTQYGLVKSFEEIQPEFRQWVDIGSQADQILASMKPKGRYNIRLAKRHGIKIASSKDSQLFFELFAQTAKRDGFQIRQAAYYQDLVATLEKHGVGELLIAMHKKEPLAAAIISYYGGTASYIYGASSSHNRELMAPYLLHWTAMQRAKDRGCRIYDLLAIAPFDSEQSTVNSKQREGSSQFTVRSSLVKKYAGITRFKQQFGGRSVHLLGSWDLPIKPLIYMAFRLAETWRRQ